MNRRDESGKLPPFVPVFEAFLRDPRHLRATARPWFSMLCHLWMRAQYTGGQVEVDATEYAKLYGVHPQTVRGWIRAMQGDGDAGVAYIRLVSSGRNRYAPPVYECLRCHALESVSARTAETAFRSLGEPKDSPSGSLGESKRVLEGEKGLTYAHEKTHLEVKKDSPSGLPSSSMSGDIGDRGERETARARAREAEPEKPTALTEYTALEILCDRLGTFSSQTTHRHRAAVMEALDRSRDPEPLERAIVTALKDAKTAKAKGRNRATWLLDDALRIWAFEITEQENRVAGLASKPTPAKLIHDADDEFSRIYGRTGGQAS